MDSLLKVMQWIKLAGFFQRLRANGGVKCGGGCERSIQVSKK